jgi:hypothetical protein
MRGESPSFYAEYIMEYLETKKTHAHVISNEAITTENNGPTASAKTNPR